MNRQLAVLKTEGKKLKISHTCSFESQVNVQGGEILKPLAPSFDLKWYCNDLTFVKVASVE